MRRLLVVCLWCAVSAGIACAEEGGLEWYQKGNEAYQAKNYAQAAEYFSKALTFAPPPQTNNWETGLSYNLACCYALLGDSTKALAALDRTLKAGYTEWRWLERDTDFAELKRTAPEAFAERVKRCKNAAHEERLTKSPIAVVSYDGDRGSFDMSQLVWDDPRGEKLTRLRTTYKLDSVAAKGKTEWERILLLLNWTATRWEHDGNHGYPGSDPFGILEAAAKGERFACIQYAIVLVNVLNSMGYPARLVGLMGEGTAWGFGKGHSVVEVWSDDFQKWVLLDGQNNAYWRARGEPQSGAECRHWLLGGMEDSLDFVGQDLRRDYARLKPQWIFYFYHVATQHNNAFFPTADMPKARPVRYVLDGQGTVPELFHQGMPYADRPLDDEAFLYPKLNQVRINLEHTNWKHPCDTLQIKLEHTCLFFDHYLARINGGAWQRCETSFPWVLQPGESRLEVKAVCAGSVESRAATVVLRNNLHQG